MTPQHLLEIRVTIVMSKLGYNLMTSLTDYQNELKIMFKHEATTDEIENALHNIEEAHIVKELDEDREKSIIDLPEDYTY